MFVRREYSDWKVAIECHTIAGGLDKTMKYGPSDVRANYALRIRQKRQARGASQAVLEKPQRQEPQSQQCIETRRCANNASVQPTRGRRDKKRTADECEEPPKPKRRRTGQTQWSNVKDTPPKRNSKEVGRTLRLKLDEKPSKSGKPSQRKVGETEISPTEGPNPLEQRAPDVKEHTVRNKHGPIKGRVPEESPEGSRQKLDIFVYSDNFISPEEKMAVHLRHNRIRRSADNGQKCSREVESSEEGALQEKQCVDSSKYHFEKSPPPLHTKTCKKITLSTYIARTVCWA